MSLIVYYFTKLSKMCWKFNEARKAAQIMWEIGIIRSQIRCQFIGICYLADILFICVLKHFRKCRWQPPPYISQVAETHTRRTQLCNRFKCFLWWRHRRVQLCQRQYAYQNVEKKRKRQQICIHSYICVSAISCTHTHIHICLFVSLFAFAALDA